MKKEELATGFTLEIDYCVIIVVPYSGMVATLVVVEVPMEL